MGYTIVCLDGLLSYYFFTTLVSASLSPPSTILIPPQEHQNPLSFNYTESFSSSSSGKLDLAGISSFLAIISQ